MDESHYQSVDDERRQRSDDEQGNKYVMKTHTHKNFYFSLFSLL